MILFDPATQSLLAPGPTDMRRRLDGLAELVRQYGATIRSAAIPSSSPTRDALDPVPAQRQMRFAERMR